MFQVHHLHVSVRICLLWMHRQQMLPMVSASVWMQSRSCVSLAVSNFPIPHLTADSASQDAVGVRASLTFESLSTHLLILLLSLQNNLLFSQVWFSCSYTLRAKCYVLLWTLLLYFSLTTQVSIHNFILHSLKEYTGTYNMMAFMNNIVTINYFCTTGLYFGGGD